MSYKTFINQPKKIIIRDKEFIDYLELIKNDQSEIMSTEDTSTKAKEDARTKWNIISAIKFTFIQLTEDNLNQEPNQ
tara:strand:+ start:617 stop:847 length:231 start_codon:yes stop_codon:yes gene_type:complete